MTVHMIRRANLYLREGRGDDWNVFDSSARCPEEAYEPAVYRLNACPKSRTLLLSGLSPRQSAALQCHPLSTPCDVMAAARNANK